MRRLVQVLILLLLLTVGGLFYMSQGDVTSPDQVLKKADNAVQLEKTKIESKSAPANLIASSMISGDFASLIGLDADFLLEELGKPVRKELSPYGYTWWVYTDYEKIYLQFGIAEDRKIVTLFATGADLSVGSVQLGQPYEEVKGNFEFIKEYSFTTKDGSYRFQITEEETAVTPLVQLGEDTFMQLYFDSFTGKLSSIRLLTSSLLLLQRPYEVFYKGELPQSPALTAEEETALQKGMEQQIFDITNIIRQRHEAEPLEWSKEVAEVAFRHSQDMAVNGYFSHFSPDGTGLKERLEEAEINYLSAGENIAAQYMDGAAAVEGWLNSPGHREALLNEQYTHLGVGVYQFYYTQNFLEKP